MSFQRKLRNLIEGRWGRWIMLGLLIFILVVFTITGEMTQAIEGWFSDDQGPKRTDVAGTFSVLPASETDVTFQEFDDARGPLCTLV